MIVGTAGHVDHGKTTLVHALTGVDTDRLPEEKARGMSIELGYAYVPLDNGDVLGFVDVPGHEKLVHTMLAGATGIDFALLVVAADDGVMPQTREHHNILTLLGIRDGAVALTKIDRVDTARVASVEHDLRQWLASSTLGDMPIIPVSARTGQGVAQLNRHLLDCALKHRRLADDRHFRLAVDRSFTLQGVGTVVTGAVHSGQVRLADRVVIAASGREARVRSIHAQNRSSNIGVAGQRCALNLPGISRDEVGRGDWIVAPQAAIVTARFDASLTLLADEPGALRRDASVQVHLGSAHVAARIVMLEDDATPATSDGADEAPTQVRFAQLVLQAPLPAWRGDRFVIRNASSTQTIGGGRVVDPFAPARYRRSPSRVAELRALSGATAETQLAALVAQAPLGVDLQRFARGGALRNIDSLVAAAMRTPVNTATSAATSAAVSPQPNGSIANSVATSAGRSTESPTGNPPLARVTGEHHDFALSDSHWRGLRQCVEEALAAFHRVHPDDLGPDSARLRRIAVPRLESAVYRALLDELIATGGVVRSGPWLHLSTHDNEPGEKERALISQIATRLRDAAFDPPWVRDLARDIGQSEAIVRAALIRAARRGELFQIVRDLFYHPTAVANLAAVATRLHEVDGDVRAATFRDETGLGRKRAIQILEFFDRVGFTRRIRDKHVVRTDNLLRLGASPVPGNAIGASGLRSQPEAERRST